MHYNFIAIAKIVIITLFFTALVHGHSLQGWGWDGSEEGGRGRPHCMMIGHDNTSIIIKLFN